MGNFQTPIKNLPLLIIFFGLIFISGCLSSISPVKISDLRNYNNQEVWIQGEIIKVPYPAHYTIKDESGETGVYCPVGIACVSNQSIGDKVKVLVQIDIGDDPYSRRAWFTILETKRITLSKAEKTTTPTVSVGDRITITIKNFAFDPSTLMVKTGTVVTWVNQDEAPHTIFSDTGSPVAFSSDPLLTGISYTFTFTQPGKYTYHCSIHPSMKGTIIVTS